jgi:hypothetical protein
MKSFSIVFAVLLLQVNLKSVESIFGIQNITPNITRFQDRMVNLIQQANAFTVNLVMSLSQCSSQPSSADPLISSNLVALCKVRTNIITYLLNPNRLNPIQRIQQAIISRDRWFYSKTRLKSACDDIILFCTKSADPISAFPNGSQIIQNLSLATSNLCSLLDTAVDQAAVQYINYTTFSLILDNQAVITLQFQNLYTSMAFYGLNVFQQAFVFNRIDSLIRALNSTAVVSSMSTSILSTWFGIKSHSNALISSLTNTKNSLAAKTSNFVAESRNLTIAWNGFKIQESQIVDNVTKALIGLYGLVEQTNTEAWGSIHNNLVRSLNTLNSDTYAVSRSYMYINISQTPLSLSLKIKKIY